jgi:hypothetical protein
MNKTKFFFAAGAILIAGAIFFSCQKEQNTSPVKEQGTMMLKSTICETSCIDLLVNPVSYYPVNDQKLVQWGGSTGTKFNKTVDIQYFNTETQFVLKVKSTEGWSDLVIDGVSSWTGGPVAPNVWGTYSIPLTAGWEACDAIAYALQVTGNGPNAVFSVSYELVGICTTTTLEVSHENPVCVGQTLVSFLGTVTSGGVFTGGAIKIQEFDGTNWNDVASADVTTSNHIVTWSYTPDAAGTRTFRAYYTGGGNGYNPSESAGQEVVAEDCGCDYVGNTFSGEAVSCDGTLREAIYTLSSENGISYFKIQGGLTNFTGGDATVYVNDILVVFDETSDDNWTQGTEGDFIVGQRTPGGSTNRNIRVTGHLEECDAIVVRIIWNSTNSGGVITGDWTALIGGISYGVDDLTCP